MKITPPPPKKKKNIERLQTFVKKFWISIQRKEKHSNLSILSGNRGENNTHMLFILAWNKQYLAIFKSDLNLICIGHF